MDTQPKIPTLKDSQKPQVKIRGLEAGVTLFDRLKQFKKKDLAFILAGLGTLFMAPLAEHFMMSPDSGDANALHQGWGQGGPGGNGVFSGDGRTPYEPGTTGLAPGSAIGGGSDIITPLNVRDPSALVMGPGSTQQPPTNSVMPGTPPPTAPVSHSDSDLKDALAASAAGVGAAAHAAKALLPIPHIALAGSGLHGLGAVSGGTSAVANSSVPNSQGLVSGRAAQNSSLGGVRPTSGYKGVARGQTGGDTTGMDALKKAAGDASGSFNRGGALAGANDAANTAIPTNTGGALGGGGAGGTGATDKAFGGDQNKDGKNVGESLAFEKQKKIQDAQIALWSKEQEAGDNKLEALKLRNTMAESIAGTVATGIGNKLNCVFDMSADGCPSAPSATSYNCTSSPAAGAKGVAPISGVKGSYQKACGSNPSAKTTQAPGVYLDSDGNIEDCSHHILGYNCTTGGTPVKSDGSDGSGGIVDGLGGANAGDLTALNGLSGVCTQLQKTIDKGTSLGVPAQNWLKGALNEAQRVATVRDALTKGARSSDCPVVAASPATNPANTATPINVSDSLINLEKAAINSMMAAAPQGVLPSAKAAATATSTDANNPIKSPDTGPMSKSVDAARTALNAISTSYGASCNTDAGNKNCTKTNIPASSQAPIPTTAADAQGKQTAGLDAGATGDPAKIAATIATAHAAVDKMIGDLTTTQKAIEEAARNSVAIAGGGKDNNGHDNKGTLPDVIQENGDYQAMVQAAAKLTPTPVTPAAVDASTPKSLDATGTTGATSEAKTAIGAALPAGFAPGSNPAAPGTSGATSTDLSTALQQYDPKKPATLQPVKTALDAAAKAVGVMQTTQTGWIDQTSATLTPLMSQVNATPPTSN